MFLRRSDFQEATHVSTIVVFYYFLKLCFPRRGSVIADLELTFNRSTYEDYLRGRLQDATKDNKLGDLDVKQVVVGRFISTGKSHCLKSPRYLVAKEIIEDLICVSGSVCNLVN